jgi:hypothetical protein
MISSKLRLINEEEDELDDKIETTNVVLKHRGSFFEHEIHDRSGQEYDMKLYRDYFSEHPTYPSKFFRRRFRIRQTLYLSITWVVEEHDNYFVQRRNANRVLGFSCLQKVTVAYRKLAHAIPTNYVDEYVRIGESTSIEFLRRFVKVVCDVFGPEYLRPPNQDDTVMLLNIAERHGFLVILGSIDYMYWK